jgi:hypothetical protein
MKTTLIRILVCVAISLSLISFGSRDPVFGILHIGIGVLVLIYGFSPGMAKSIISAIVKIVTAPFKR